MGQQQKDIEIEGEGEQEIKSQNKDKKQSNIEKLKIMAKSADNQVKAVVDKISQELTQQEQEVSSLRQAKETSEENMKKSEAQAKLIQDKFLRLNADFDNYRKRSAKEVESMGGTVRVSLVKDLLPLIDNFVLAQNNIKPANEGEEKINQTYLKLYQQLMDIFKGMGLKEVPGAGSPFDPEYHEAIMREETSDVEEGNITMEFRKGYTLGEKLVRASMVKVAYNPEPGNNSQEAEQTDTNSDEQQSQEQG